MRTDRRTDRRKDRQTDMMNIIVAFCNFAKAPKNPQPILMFLLGLETFASPESFSSNVFDIK